MKSEIRKSDKWIPWYFVAFFVVLAILDGIFVTIATSTHTGLVTEHSYQKGLDYNKTIAAFDLQEKLDWSGKVEFTQPLLSFQISNNKSDAKVTAYIMRATQAGHDFQIPLTHVKNGKYSQNINFPLKGQWKATVVAQWNQQQYQQSKNIIVK